jgi:endo-1,4-beta-xylanase
VLTSRRTETFAAVLAVAALAAGSLLAVTTASVAAPTVVDATDFQDGTTGSWTQNGAATHEVVSLGKVLQVAGRSHDYDGPQLTGLALTAGTTYTVSLAVRLDPALPAGSTTQARLVAVPGYSWIGNGTIGTDDWTTLTGEYTVPAGDGVVQQLYLGSDTLTVPAGADAVASFGMLIDDIRIAPTDAPDAPVVDTDFEDGTPGPWAGNGDAALAVVDDRVLAVSGRTAGYEGIQLNVPLTAGTAYDVSFRARLADGVAGTTSARMIAHLGDTYTWVGNTEGVSASAWTRVAGTFTPDTAGTFQLYPEFADIAGLASFGYLIDDLRITAADDAGGGVDPGDPSVLNTGFETGLDGWAARADSNGTPTFDRTQDDAHAGEWAGMVSDRASQGSGLQHDATGVLVPGASYAVSAWVRFAANPVDSFVLSIARTTGGTTTYANLVTFTPTMSSAEWVQVTGAFTAPAFDTASVYFETTWYSDQLGNQTTFLIDDIEFTVPEPAVIQDLEPIIDTVDFPVGVAIDSRETSGSPRQLLLRHFDQVTAENAMKPESWYDASGVFTPSAEADAVMDFAAANELRVYGHVLVWHSQTPGWFFESAPGVPLTTSAADQQVLKDRMRSHIFAVAEHLADEYGAFGSAGNPLVAFDVVNEVVSDAAGTPGGLRTSEWFRILGEDFIDLAFAYADEAFNDVYADAAADRPVTLFINDYNTEQSGKQQRYHALVERLLARGVPVDGVGHQFHVSLSMPVTALADALDAFDDLGLPQAVTELDVTTGTPVTEAKLVDQGYYYRDAFRSFRAYDASSDGGIYSVTVWGLTDGRSWRNDSGAPLVFDDGLQAKPAYYGIVDDELPAPLRTANVFAADLPLAPGVTNAPEWDRMPLHAISAAARFQLRWQPDQLTVLVEVDDTTSGGDTVAFQLGDDTVTLDRDAGGTPSGVVAETATGYRMTVELPLVGAAQGDTLAFDVRVTDGSTTTGWNATGETGTLTLLEPLSFLEVVEAEAVPVIDGVIDDAWDEANAVTTAKHVEGAGAEATVRTLWTDGVLYVLALVDDPIVDVSGSDPWVQDSVELYVDPGNAKNGSYRYDDSQIRISAANEVSFGTGDEAFQRGRVQSATATIDGGYLVEAAITLGDAAALGSFQGLDFQVNDASGGARTGISNWADPSGAGYQSTARWGVGELVGPAGSEPEEPGDDDPTVTLGSSTVRAGGRLDVSLSGFGPGTVVALVLDRPASAAGGGGAGGFAVTARAASAAALPATLGTLTVGAGGTASGTVTIPADVDPGTYRLGATASGQLLASGQLTVLAALAATGADAGGPLGAALLLLLAGAVLAWRARRRVADAR